MRWPIRFCPMCGERFMVPDHPPITLARRIDCPGCGESMYRPWSVGVAVFLVEEGRLLLGQRREGAWCIPCGYLEGDEEPAEGARREFREETGLEVEILGVRAAKTNRHRPDQRSVGLWFNGVRLGGKLEAKDDLRAVEWFLPHEIPHLAFPTDEEVIAQWRRQMSAGGEAGA